MSLNHCKIFSTHNQYGAAILGERENYQNDDLFDEWNQLVPFLSYCEDSEHMHYDGEEYTATANNTVVQEFIKMNDPYTFSTNVLMFGQNQPSITVTMGGVDVTGKYSQINPGETPDGQPIENSYEYRVEIPHVYGNIEITYVS